MRNLWILLCLTAAVSCSEKAGPQVGGETHWLAICARNSDCGDEGLSCVCGTCTKACSGDDSCADSRCVDTGSPLLQERCAEDALDTKPAVCLAECETKADCGEGRTCNQGACVPEAGLSVSDFDNTSDEVSWAEPVVLPELVESIEGADESIAGVWTHVACDIAKPPMLSLWGCATIVIEKNATGAFTGRLRIDRNEDVLGPFAPARDPDRGYPSEVSVEKYSYVAANPQARVDYRLLNGRKSGNTMTFDWSRYDVWTEWCQMQRPYHWRVADRSFYFCAPQDPAEQAKLDEGKVVLCRSADFEPICGEGNNRQPCVCVDRVSPRCSPAYCSCDSRSCGMARFQTSAELEFAQDRKTAMLLLPDFDWTQRITLQRVEQ